MKKIVLFLVTLSMLLLACTNTVEQTSPQEKQDAVKQDNTELKEQTKKCENIDIDYKVSNIETKIEPRPNEAKREYDSGYLKFNLLNKDKTVNGYFNVSIECVLSSGSNKEYDYVNLDAGDVKDIRLTCSKRGTILSINGPTIESAPKKEICN